MDPLSDFMASSHLSESGPTIASPQLIGSLLSNNMTYKTGLPYHSEVVRILVTLRGTAVTWSEVSWSLSSASTSTGVCATRTTSCALLHTGWSDGSITSSSLHHPPTQFFQEKPFLEKEPDSRNNSYCFRIWIRRYTQLFWVSYEDVLYPLWVRA